MTDTAEHRPAHPVVFLVLYLPYGIASGYVTVTLGWLLTHAGASVGQVALVKLDLHEAPIAQRPVN